MNVYVLKVWVRDESSEISDIYLTRRAAMSAALTKATDAAATSLNAGWVSVKAVPSGYELRADGSLVATLDVRQWEVKASPLEVLATAADEI